MALTYFVSAFPLQKVLTCPDLWFGEEQKNVVYVLSHVIALNCLSNTNDLIITNY